MHFSYIKSICVSVYLFVGVLDAVKNAFSRSTDAVKRADRSADTVNRSASVRRDATEGLKQVQPINTQKLQNLEKDLATRPNLTPTATQVRIQTNTFTSDYNWRD